MRDIKFRGKTTYCFTDPPECEWVYGSLQISYEGFTRIIPLDPAGPWCGVGPETVGQYTGLKDKNGVEIYEGDVLKFSWDSIGERVEFYGVVRFIKSEAAFLYFDETLKTWNSFHGDTNDMEVIGNVFDNPEFNERFGTPYREL